MRFPLLAFMVLGADWNPTHPSYFWTVYIVFGWVFTVVLMATTSLFNFEDDDNDALLLFVAFVGGFLWPIFALGLLWAWLMKGVGPKALGEHVEQNRRRDADEAARKDVREKIQKQEARRRVEAEAREELLLEQGSQLPTRPRIPEKVRNEVWRRDEGRCARCGSRERLEYDHIVPVSRGGSNTARNLELLCERCNREKGASIG